MRTKRGRKQGRAEKLQNSKEKKVASFWTFFALYIPDLLLKISREVDKKAQRNNYPTSQITWKKQAKSNQRLGNKEPNDSDQRDGGGA